MVSCCGKRLCSGCPTEVARRSVIACSCCGAVRAPGLKSLIGRLKKQAKMGAVWAQSILGIMLHQNGSLVDGLRWVEKAAKGGHPAACFVLGREFMGGQSGLSLSYGRAREYLERAMALDDTWSILCSNSLVELAGKYDREGQVEAFKSILLPLVNSGFSLAQARFAVSIYDNKKDPLAAYLLSKSALLGFEDPYYIAESAYWTMVYSDDLERFAISKLLLPMASKSLSVGKKSVKEKKTRLALLVATKKGICTFRKGCATCGIALDRSNRKLCKGCRNHCYSAANVKRCIGIARRMGIVPSARRRRSSRRRLEMPV